MIYNMGSLLSKHFVMGFIKRTTVKHLKNSLYVCMYTKLFLEYFNSIFFINHVTNVLTEVVPYCKLGHNYYVVIFCI